MDINVSLIGQMITFIIFVWFTMRYVWPPLRKAMEDRQKTIADGLAAGEQGKRDLEVAQHKSVEILREAKLTASHIIEEANKRAGHITEEAKENARVESFRLLEQAKGEIENQVNQAKRDIREQVGNLSISAAEKIVKRDIDPSAHQAVLNDLLAEI